MNMNPYANNPATTLAGYEGLIPCQPTKYGEAAAFRFQLPGPRHDGEPNEYVAFVLPRLKCEPPPQAAAPNECPNACASTEQRRCCNTPPPDGCCAPRTSDLSVSSVSRQRRRCPAPQPRPACCSGRWSTEYRSTIDECAKWVIDTEMVCKRKPIYPVQCITVDRSCDDAYDHGQYAAEGGCPTFSVVPQDYYRRTCEPAIFQQGVGSESASTRPPVPQPLTSSTVKPYSQSSAVTGGAEPTAALPSTTAARQQRNYDGGSLPSANEVRERDNVTGRATTSSSTYKLRHPSGQSAPPAAGRGGRPLPRCKPDSQAYTNERRYDLLSMKSQQHRSE